MTDYLNEGIESLNEQIKLLNELIVNQNLFLNWYKKNTAEKTKIIENNIQRHRNEVKQLQEHVSKLLKSKDNGNGIANEI